MEATQTQTKTATSVLYPIVSALVSAEEELGPQRAWLAQNDAQHQFLELVHGPSRNEVNGIPELESLASQNIEAVNNFLRERGFTITLRPTGQAGDIGVASVLKLTLEWLLSGKGVELQAKGTTNVYPGVRLQEDAVEFFESPYHLHPIVQIFTRSGDEVFLTKVSGTVSESFLRAIAGHVLSELKSSKERYDGVIFPMIDLDMQPDISWLCGLSTVGKDGVPAVISQAIQQTKFCMDEVGAKVESAVAMMVSRGIIIDAPQPYVINQPFLAIVKRPSLKQPIFIGYLDTDCWKKPAR